jgi:eukaryotic-like serine/threonine-protein kinase
MSAVVVGLAPGAVVDGCEVLRELGDGGFAFVYLVKREGQLYALKVARHREKSGDATQTHVRMLRELAVLAQLVGHPHVAQLRGHGYLPGSGNMYLLLEYVEGWTLAQWLECKHPTVHEVLRVFEKLAAALASMHSRGFLHRDLKLANVLVRQSDGEPVIIDFGCADHAMSADLTGEGLPPGTDRFRAPEQFKFLREHKEEHRARYAFQVADEIFAYGAMLYELLTDARPTQERPRPSLNHLLIPPEAPLRLNPRVPVEVSEWVESLLARAPARRPVDTETLLREVAELAAITDAEYTQPVHPPLAQRQPAPAPPEEEQAPAVPEPAPPRFEGSPRTSKGALRSRMLQAGAGLGVAALALGLTLWRWPSAGPTPTPSPAQAVAAAPVASPAAPEAPPASPPAMPTPPPARAVDPDPAGPADTQKEGSTVTIQQPKAPQEASTLRGTQKPPSSALCKTLPFLAAVAAGCTGLPVRPAPFECPERVQRIMLQELGWEHGDVLEVALDDRWDRNVKGGVVFRPGAEIVSVVPEDHWKQVGRIRWKGIEGKMVLKAPAGTKFWGRVYVDPQDVVAGHRGEPAALLVKYERAKLPGQEEVPVCAVGRSDKAYKVEKDGATRASNGGGAVVYLVYQGQ